MSEEMLDFYPYAKTEVGGRKISAALAQGKPLNLTHISVGDGGGQEYEPTKNQTALVNETWRGEINRKVISPNDPNIVIVTGIIPSNVGGFFVREVGLYDEEGDLIYIFAYASSYKPPQGSNIAKDMSIELWLIVEDQATFELTADTNAVIATLQDLWALEEKFTPEIGTVTLTNSLVYPFNSSGMTVALGTTRDTLDYMVHTEVVSAEGMVGDVVVSDKHTNGFRLSFTGSGNQVVIKYFVTGGLNR